MDMSVITNSETVEYANSLPSQIIILANIFQWAGVSYNKVPYPGWAEFLGWVMALSSMLLIPGVALYEMWRTPGTLKEVRVANE